METRPQSPQPPGAPRWAAMFYDPASASWRLGAESPDRTPVLYAIGEMAQVKRARGDEVTVALWGPQDGAWRRFDASAADAAPQPPPSEDAVRPASGKLAERMQDRRHQVLMAGLSKAGLYDLTPDDVTAVQTLVDRLDETTLRRVAHWMAVAGSGR
ncbi:hypothetical protein [Streptomyces aurantiogriseus]|uniref:Uncharacterized protein n=1 Tax=Streptomyces aurantiogriseus TaxID=66870 RepID=A0A918F0L1_9ACTN|nr:hypothetical protein [Streptomyces aurantiogriseus]GGQ90097.1 hypothetical protein GCM10010251_00200 [Streptomyces aurantiogriseus]